MVEEMIEQEALDESSYGERVREAISRKTVNKTVPISFPQKTFVRFSRWALENAADCYWLAIEKLLNHYDQQIAIHQQVQLLMERDDFLLSEINRLENVPLEGGSAKKKHFGQVKEKEGE